MLNFAERTGSGVLMLVWSIPTNTEVFDVMINTSNGKVPSEALHCTCPYLELRQMKVPTMAESLISGDRAEVGGVLCNDANGLCLLSKGNMNSADADSGVYTSLVRLASQLSTHQQPMADGSNPPAPLITVEYEQTAILVKEYHGHTVALKVPSSQTASAQTEKH